ncbi:hypothetical protein F2P81_025063 [Scophthalmus maximus]|uniref:Uncharacterized protein n=1 Tax=Scophthalmus maximus TaxID=52904 RepID=A0A6A4RU27_SCOMX|nr:hypothetical protein F2P81_025063 [Scophthalmus maximus]
MLPWRRARRAAVDVQVARHYQLPKRDSVTAQKTAMGHCEDGTLLTVVRFAHVHRKLHRCSPVLSKSLDRVVWGINLPGNVDWGEFQRQLKQLSPLVNVSNVNEGVFGSRRKNVDVTTADMLVSSTITGCAGVVLIRGIVV